MATTRPRKIFLDANVVIRAGKPPGGPLIGRVADLVDAGYVKVVTTDLTKMEIAKKHAGNDFEVIGNLTKRRVRDLADEIFGVKLPGISPADLQRKLLEKHQASVEKMFRLLRAETLSIDSVKPSVVFDAYARKAGLFGDDAKKDQFPDAFIFETLKAAATKGDPLTIDLGRQGLRSGHQGRRAYLPAQIDRGPFRRARPDDRGGSGRRGLCREQSG
jgi:hypothetical protein